MFGKLFGIDRKKRDSLMKEKPIDSRRVQYLVYLWEKDHIYTIVAYDDGEDIQKIVTDFDNNANYAQV